MQKRTRSKKKPSIAKFSWPTENGGPALIHKYEVHYSAKTDDKITRDKLFKQRSHGYIHHGGQRALIILEDNWFEFELKN